MNAFWVTAACACVLVLNGQAGAQMNGDAGLSPISEVGSFGSNNSSVGTGSMPGSDLMTGEPGVVTNPVTAPLPGEPIRAGQDAVAGVECREEEGAAVYTCTYKNQASVVTPLSQLHYSVPREGEVMFFGPLGDAAAASDDVYVPELSSDAPLPPMFSEPTGNRLGYEQE